MIQFWWHAEGCCETQKPPSVSSNEASAVGWAVRIRIHLVRFIMIRYLTAGESHGEALIGIVEGVPAGVPLVALDIDQHLARRWMGFGRGGRAKIEQDRVHIYSGVRFSTTMGSPIALRLNNAAYRKDKSDLPNVMAIG